ncbi:MAG: hypothetical protein PHU06_06855 [Gallionella sp.]|nr:hypothetical protein [Gallionella sp.]MDD4958021.1 hypothetical protein [Gallionella sp.]
MLKALFPTATSSYRLFLLLVMAWLALFAPQTFAAHDTFLSNLARDAAQNKDTVTSIRQSMPYLAVGYESGKIDLWNTTKPNAKLVIPAHTSRASELTFSPNGEILFSNSYFEDSTQIWSTDSGKLLHTIQKMRGPVSATWLENIYVVANSSELKIFDWRDRTLHETAYPVSGVVTSLTFDKEQRRIGVGTASGSIEIWTLLSDTASPTLTRIASIHPYEIGNWVQGVYFAHGNGTVYTVARFGSVDEWQLDSLQKIRSISVKLSHISASAWMPDAGVLALTGSQNSSGIGQGYVEVLSLSTNKSFAHQAQSTPRAIEFLSQEQLVIVGEYPKLVLHPCHCALQRKTQ